MATKHATILPVVSKLFCSSSEAIFVVRNRPLVANGGGFVVTDPITQKVIFRVDGCGVLGKKEEMILRDANGTKLLLIRRKRVGIVEALISVYRRWNGYIYNYSDSGSHQKLGFWLNEPIKSSSCVKSSPIRITIQSRKSTIYKVFEIKGYFPDRACSIVEHSTGIVIAQVGIGNEVMFSRDLYHVIIKPGIDQAFVFGVIAILDYIYGGSTRC